MPLTLMDVKELGGFNELLGIAGPYLPLDFITGMYQYHKESGCKGYDHQYLVNSVRIAGSLLENSPLPPNEISLTFAILFLMETGHRSSDEFPYEVAGGLSFFFLEKFAPKFFCKADARFISKNCRPIYPHSLRLSARVKIQLTAHNARLLTDVVYPNLSKLVVNFVRLNKAELKELDEDTPDVKGWTESLGKKFAEYYGVNGVLWESLSVGAKEVYLTEIYEFTKLAHDQQLIHNLIHQYTKQIFA